MTLPTPTNEQLVRILAGVIFVLFFWILGLASYAIRLVRSRARMRRMAAHLVHSRFGPLITQATAETTFAEFPAAPDGERSRTTSWEVLMDDELQASVEPGVHRKDPL